MSISQINQIILKKYLGENQAEEEIAKEKQD